MIWNNPQAMTASRATNSSNKTPPIIICEPLKGNPSGVATRPPSVRNIIGDKNSATQPPQNNYPRIGLA